MSISAITKDKFTLKPVEVDEMRRRQSSDEEDDAEHDDENCNSQEKSNGNSSKDGNVLKSDGEQHSDYGADYTVEGSNTNESDGEIGQCEYMQNKY